MYVSFNGDKSGADVFNIWSVYSDMLNIKNLTINVWWERIVVVSLSTQLHRYNYDKPNGELTTRER